MSEIIRDAVIRLRLETQKAKLESPEISQATRAYAEQAKASEVTQRQTRENISLTKEHSRTVQEFGVHAARSFKDGLEGTIQFARGMALMTASGEEDTKKLLEAFAKIEAATALVRGATNLAKFGMSFGPVGIAVAAVSAAAGLGVVAWQRYAQATERAKQELENAKKAAADMADELTKVYNAARQRELSAAERRARYIYGDNPELADQAIRDELRVQFNANAASQARNRSEARSPEERRRVEVGLEEQRLGLLQRRMDLDAELYDRQKQEVQYRQQAYAASLGGASAIAVAMGGGTGLGGLAGEALGANRSQAMNQVMDQLVAAQQSAMQKLLDAFRSAEENIVKLRNELNAANPK